MVTHGLGSVPSPFNDFFFCSAGKEKYIRLLKNKQNNAGGMKTFEKGKEKTIPDTLKAYFRVWQKKGGAKKSDEQSSPSVAPSSSLSEPGGRLPRPPGTRRCLPLSPPAALPRLRDGHSRDQDLHRFLPRSGLRHHQVHDSGQRAGDSVLPSQDDEGGQGGTGAGAVPPAQQGRGLARRFGRGGLRGQGELL